MICISHGVRLTLTMTAAAAAVRAPLQLNRNSSSELHRPAHNKRRFKWIHSRVVFMEERERHSSEMKNRSTHTHTEPEKVFPFPQKCRANAQRHCLQRSGKASRHRSYQIMLLRKFSQIKLPSRSALTLRDSQFSYSLCRPIINCAT